MTDTYNEIPRKGEIEELREELMSTDQNKKRDAVRKVIAAMTIGKDNVSSLFMEMLHSINTSNLEVKKLVYLYLTNYAQAKPDMALLAVNAFVQDASHDNPLIRALAIRTMGSIRVATLSEYLCEPLRLCLEDSDPYVRKTAALTVAKVYDVSPELIQDQGFLEKLQELLNDENNVVISNAATALAEIAASHPDPSSVLTLTPSLVMSLLSAMDSCTEWGQIALLDVMSAYVPIDEASVLCERLLPRLQHRNSALVLATVKLILKWSIHLNKNELSFFENKLTPSLVSLMSGSHEIQYVALRSIQLIVVKSPHLLSSHYKPFFCKYNDPVYVKLEKVDVLVSIATDDNVAAILAEFQDYCNEVDVDFVRKSVRAIGLCAIKLQNSATFCVEQLLSLMKNKVSHVVQEGISVIRDIFRRYPNTYEASIAVLCNHLTSLDEPDAKAAMVWIVGEYANRIANVADLIEIFVETFLEEPVHVQLAILTATVKCYLRKPREVKPFLSKVLDYSTNQSDNPDLRDRGFIYWRLLSLSPEAAKKVVFADKPVIDSSCNQLDPVLHEKLMSEIGSLAAVLHKDPVLLVPKLRRAAEDRRSLEKTEEVIGVNGEIIEENNETSDNNRGDDILDLLSLDEKPNTLASSSLPSSSVPSSDVLDLASDVSSRSTATPPAVSQRNEPQNILLSANQSKGLVLCGEFIRNGDKMAFKMELTNTTSLIMSNIVIQFNINVLGITPDSNFKVDSINPSSTLIIDLPVNYVASRKKILPDPTKNCIVQAGVKYSNEGPFFFAIPLSISPFLLKAKSTISKAQFIAAWSAVDDSKAERKVFNLGVGFTSNLVALVKSLIDSMNMNVIFTQSNGNSELINAAAVAVDGSALVLNFGIKNSNPSDLTVTVKTPAMHLCRSVFNTIEQHIPGLVSSSSSSPKISSSIDDLLMF
ncbi:hypothetical protein RCL1_003843 [Eukaryota sp. TZLM3-RCL]